MNSPRIIQGHDGPIEINEAKRTVTKTYRLVAHEAGVRMVEREVSHATRLRQVLAHHDGLDCPRVLAWDLSVPPRITLELCAGEPLSSLLGRVGRRDARSTDIAAKIHDGLEIYARLFEEPYYDLCFRNILYDEATRVLTFLDFDIPSRSDENSRGSALEMSLGNLVGWACYDMVRPSQLLAPKPGYLKVMRATLAAFEGQVSRPRVRALARATFMRLTEAGSTARRSYYRTAGTVVAALYMKYVGLGSGSAVARDE